MSKLGVFACIHNHGLVVKTQARYYVMMTTACAVARTRYKQRKLTTWACRGAYSNPNAAARTIKRSKAALHSAASDSARHSSAFRDALARAAWSSMPFAASSQPTLEEQQLLRDMHATYEESLKATWHKASGAKMNNTVAVDAGSRCHGARTASAPHVSADIACSSAASKSAQKKQKKPPFCSRNPSFVTHSARAPSTHAMMPRHSACLVLRLIEVIPCLSIHLRSHR